MQRIISVICAVVMTCFSAFAQDKAVSLNTNADSIVGIYYVTHEGEESKIQISKNPDGTYMAKCIWVRNPNDANGKRRLDEKNPDKSLRSVPCDQIQLFDRLKYIPSKASWGDTKIYDPLRGIKANLTAKFVEEGKLSIKGSLMGISETIYWKKISE